MVSDQKITISTSVPTLTTPFNINDYIDWFDKINLNVLIWQIIVIVIIFYFGKEIKMILKGLIDKIPHLKSVAGVEFQLSEETKQEIAEKSEVLNSEIAPYIVAIEQDINLVFLNHFIEFERNLDKLYWEAFPNARDFMRESPEKMLDNLVSGQRLDDKAISAYYDIRKIRNAIAHGKKVFTDVEDARPYLQTLFLLKEIVSGALLKISKEAS